VASDVLSLSFSLLLVLLEAAEVSGFLPGSSRVDEVAVAPLASSVPSVQEKKKLRNGLKGTFSRNKNNLIKFTLFKLEVFSTKFVSEKLQITPILGNFFFI
jgi:hypothetical protein